MLTEKMRSHSRYPLTDTQQDMAQIVAPFFSQKVMAGKLTVDAQAMMDTFNMSIHDVEQVVAWYEDGLLSTKFEIINTPQHDDTTGLPS